MIYVWASYQIRIIAGAHAPGMPGTFSPPPRVSDPDMHHGTCVTHVPWCMPGSLTSSFLWSWWRGKTFPAFPAHAQPAILRIWQEAHVLRCHGVQWVADQICGLVCTLNADFFGWNAFFQVKMYKFQLTFHWSLFLMVRLTITQLWLRKWLGGGQATSHYLKQWWFCLMTHICVTRP